MPITKEMLAARRGWVGASELGALFGVDEYSSAWNVWAHKCGLIEDQPASEAADAGNMLEPALIDVAERSLGPLDRNVTVPADGLQLVSNLDARIRMTGHPVDAKTSGLYGPLSSEWGEAGTAEVPKRIILQLHGQMLCTGADAAYVQALLGGRGFVLFHVKRNESLIDLIAQRVDSFWRDNVLAKVPPEDSEPTLEVIKHIRMQPGKVVVINQQLIEEWDQAKAAAAAAKELQDACEVRVREALGDAEAGLIGTERVLTRPVIEVGEKIVKAYSYRRLSTRKLRKGELDQWQKLLPQS